MTKSPRLIAFEVLYDVHSNKTYANLALKNQLKGSSSLDASFVTRIVYGVLQNQLLIDYYIKSFTTGKRIKPKVLVILRMGVYQILFMDKIPDSATVNESVLLMKTINLSEISGFVNGVLRSISREKDDLPEVVAPTRASWLSIMYSHPLWLVEKFISEFGTKTAEKIIKSNNQKADIICRINTLKTTENEIDLSAVEFENVGENIVRISNTGDIESLDIFKNGEIYVQDYASQYSIMALEPKPDCTLIDCCSAPGGKSFLSAQYMENKGEILAFDIHEHKMEIIDKSAQRLGIDIVKTDILDATKFNPELEKTADFLICDVPCSGLGIIRRKPEIRFKEDISSLPDIQFEILQNVSRYLKSGGAMIYSTCTIISDENKSVVERFLSENADFYLEDFSLPFGTQNMITLLPHLHKTDGFFIAKLRRK